MKNKGQIILTVMMWMTGISITITTGSFYYNLTRFQKNDEDHSLIRERIVKVEEAATRIPILETKIDKLLEKQGISFYATTTRK